MTPPQTTEQRLDVVQKLRDHIAQPDVLSTHQARLYSRSVRHQLGSTEIQWSAQLSSEQFQDVQRLVHASQIANECGDNELSKHCMIRAAQILEWLGKTEDMLLESVPINFLSAAAYQLAGLPAMALGVIPDTDILSEQILKEFLDVKLNKVLILLADYWYTRAKENQASELMFCYIDELFQGIGIISSYLTLGVEERLQNAIEKLNILSLFSADGSDVFEWLFCFLVKEVSGSYVNDSIWTVLQALKNTVTEDGWLRLQRFAKFSCKQDRPLLWPSQKLGVQRLATMESFAMCTPTGSGKTTVAHLAVLQSLSALTSYMESEIAPLVLYLVPSRALAAEAEFKLEQLIRQIDKDVIITGLYGGADWGISDMWFTSESPAVLICTVEKAEALLRYMGGALLNRMKLLILDEAHQVGFIPSKFAQVNLLKGESREQRLEAFVSRLLSNCPTCRVVALSAVANGIEKIIASWITGDEAAQPVGGNYRSTRQFIGTLNYSPHGQASIALEILDGNKLQLQDRATEAYVPLGFRPPPKLNAPIRNSLYKYNHCYTFWIATHFAQAEKRVLISVTEGIEKVIEVISSAMEQLKAAELPQFFSVEALTGQDANLYKKCLEVCIDYCGINSFEATLLEQGIAIHHGQMPVKVRLLITKVIERGIAPITIATSTLTEGVNLPFDVVLLPRVVREPFDETLQQRHSIIMSSFEFLNLAGRAGRPGFGSEGMTLIMKPVSPSTTAAGQKPNQYKQVQKLEKECNQILKGVVEQQQLMARSPIANLIKAIYYQWKKLAATDDQDAFYNWLEKTITIEEVAYADLAETLDVLDQFLLSALHEFELLNAVPLSPDNIEKFLGDLWKKTFAYASLENSQAYELAIQRRGIAITDKVLPDIESRRRVYRLGLPPQKAIRFMPFVKLIEQQLQNGLDYATWDSNAQLNYITDTLKIVAYSEEFGFSSSYRHAPVTIWEDILCWWLCAPNALNPEPIKLRHWLRFSNTNFDYKFGLAIGATLTEIWAKGTEPGDVPSMVNWEEKMGLPWIGFWFRELIKWGTLEPFVAYMLSRGHANSRREAQLYKPEYETWYSEMYPVDSNDSINPTKYREWEKQYFTQSRVRKKTTRKWSCEIKLDGDVPEKLRVFPYQEGERILWFDAAGYLVAESKGLLSMTQFQSIKRNYFLNKNICQVSSY